MKQSYILHGVLLHRAPDAKAQELCTAIYNRMQADGLTEDRIQLNIVQALNDGLAHGNWPWKIVPNIQEAIESHYAATADPFNPYGGEIPLFVVNPDGEMVDNPQHPDFAPEPTSTEVKHPTSTEVRYNCYVCKAQKPYEEVQPRRGENPDSWYWVCRDNCAD
jgi:hypothetical protein